MKNFDWKTTTHDDWPAWPSPEHGAARGPCDPAEPALSEREFSMWLTRAQRKIPEGEGEIGERVAAYDGGLLTEFFASLPERIAFWEQMLASLDARTVGAGQVSAYIERLEWVASLETSSEFLARDGHQRFHIVSLALAYGVASALRYIDGSSVDWDDDDLQVAMFAVDELRFLIYQQRGAAVEFRTDGPNRARRPPWTRPTKPVRR